MIETTTPTYIRLGEWGVGGSTRIEWARVDRPGHFEATAKVVIVRTPNRDIAAAWYETIEGRYYVGPRRCVEWSGRALSDLGPIVAHIAQYAAKWPLHGGWFEPAI
jgi:hypothetical protein